jgi:phosphodiesterase/alkaline phosphatase D-like protein
MKKHVLLLCMCLLSMHYAMADQTIFAAGASWKFLDNGSNQGTAWRAASFSDAAWASGLAELGYGDGGEATVVNGGPTSSRFITTYFRRSISIPSVATFTGYTMNVKRDDGVVVYVNGTEVYRNNMPTGAIAFNTVAAATASDDGASFLSANLPASAFVAGTNVIAVEIHQRNGTSSDISFDMSLIGVEGNSAVNEVIYQWSGAMKPTSATVVAKLTNASTTCRLVVSTSSSLSNPILSANATASSSNNFMAKMVVNGLTPNTSYFYAVQSGGVTDNSSDDIGQFKTPASGAFSYTFAVGSCAVSSNHQAYTLMRNKAPLMFVMTGDFHYANPNSTSISTHRLPYEQNMLSQTPSRNFLLQTPFAFVWDDHDYCGNNSGGASTGRANARQAYQEYVPHYALAAGTGNVPIYQSFTIGRVHFILSDLRSERASGTIMGSAQKAWFKNECLFAKNNNLMIAWVSGVSFGGNQTDNWGGFTAERTELSNFFRDNNIANMFILSGDAHMLAIDNGSNHDFSSGTNNPYDYPVFQAAAINNSGSTKGGTYSQGGTFPNPSSSTGQYGMVEVTDNGASTITIKFTGYRTSGNTTTESVLTTYTFTRTLSSVARLTAADFSLRSVKQGRQIQLSWNKAEQAEMLALERSSDGENYEQIATVNAADGTYGDLDAVSGWNYYRVKNNANKVVSENKIYNAGNIELLISPNPATSTIDVQLKNLTEAAPSRYMIYNMNMKTMLQGDVSYSQGQASFPIDITSLSAGQYILHVVINGAEITEKLIVN